MNPHFEAIEKQAKRRLNRRIKQAKVILRNRIELEDDSFSDSLHEVIESAKWHLHTITCGNPNDWDASTPQEHHASWIKHLDEGYSPSRSEAEDFALEWKNHAENYDIWLAAVTA